jgi:cytochrome c oxidase accessory protein FixG
MSTASERVEALSPSEDHDIFRDELASVARDGRRRWIYARQPTGRFYRWRTAVGVLLLAFLFLAPFVTINGQPLMMLNILERRFVLFGVFFRPQDFYVVVMIALAVLVTMVLVTVVFGRIWCGWLCPQTVFMEMLFRRLEYLIDGSAEQQLRRDRGPWTASRIARYVFKHAVFFALSFVIANVFLAWIIGAPALEKIVTDPPSQHLAGLVSILIFSSVFFLVFARFREQACVLACPYGRMLSALTDNQTVMVTYDTRRGEPRGRVSRDTAGRASGDCVDCHQCVTVCPTGIDIRNGIQLECVNCTSCIDACDSVMTRLGRPIGLIRYASHASVSAASTGRARLFTPRVAGYAAVWVLLLAAAATLLFTRPDLDVLVLRQPGTLYATLATGDVANFYQLQAFNRTARPTSFTISVSSPQGATLTTLGAVGEVGAYGQLDGRVMLQVPRTALTGPSTPVRFLVRTSDGRQREIESAFLGPTAAASR